MPTPTPEDLRQALGDPPRRSSRGKRTGWRAAQAASAMEFKRRGGLRTSVSLQPQAVRDIEFVLEHAEFEDRSAAMCRAVAMLADDIRGQAQRQALSAADQQLLDRLCEEARQTQGAVLGLALRYMDTQLSAGVKVQA